MKRNIQLTTLFAFTLAAVLVCVADFSARGQKVKADDDEASKIERGFAIAPVPLNLAGKNRALVGLGSYIVNAQGSCNECHTNPSFKFGGNPFLGQPEQVEYGRLPGGWAGLRPLHQPESNAERRGAAGGADLRPVPAHHPHGRGRRQAPAERAFV